jgi:outer membrane protein assembly factor BamA
MKNGNRKLIILLSVFFILLSNLLFTQSSETTKPREIVIIGKILIVGNKTTKNKIILRELAFQENDTILREDIPQKMRSAKQNLLNTSLFNFVSVDTLPVDKEHFDIIISVSERWYIWPIPILGVQERNFNIWWETKNLDRVYYGFSINKENFRGRKEELSLFAQFGYTERYGLSYTIPYLTKKQKSGAGFSFTYSRNHEIPYETFDNQVIYFDDQEKYLREEFIGKLYYTYRIGIHNSHYLEGKFVNSTINDTLNKITTDYFIGNETLIHYFALDYKFRSDYRDSKVYALQGYMYEFQCTRLGLGLLKDENIDVTNFYLTLKDFQKVSNRFFAAGSFRIKFSPNTYQPYYVQRALGWNNDYVRGYEYYAIDGQRFGLAKIGLKYEIIKPHVKSVPVPLEKFSTFHYALYGGIFADAGYVDDNMYSVLPFHNPLANNFLYGAGVGIDYVTYYDVVIRFEYSINRMLETGFFVHFNVGI